MKLYFVRHGETEWNVKKKIQGKTDIPLNEKGMLQAKQLAERLQEEQKNGTLHVKRIYTSPHRRAADTAKEAANALGLSCMELEKLKEMDLGAWEGTTWDAVRENDGETYAVWNANRRYLHTPGGECYNDVLKRTLEALEQILTENTEDVLIVTHSAVLMALRCYLKQQPFDEMAVKFKTKNAEMIQIDAQEIREALKRFAAGE
ncbi:MAG: histidine phosphatase family protein [Clostridiales bacterium]|nr:histidine phosphatase family protein [Clostridiales bacterium]